MERLTYNQPSPELVDLFYKKVGSIMDRIEFNLKEDRSLAELRDYLLPKLISGDIRIRDAKKFVEAA
jgi:type I restriction enzyme S subunit